MSVWTIHFDLGEEGEARTVAVLSESLDLGLRTRLLIPKLVAGECEDLESALGVLTVELHHLPVVLVGQTSISRHVDNHHALFAL